MTARMPVLFLGHGSPMNAIEDNAWRRGWAEAVRQGWIPEDLAVTCPIYRGDATQALASAMNLNAPGASFVPLAFEQSAHTPQPGMKPGASVPNRFYMYGVIGRLAMLAASYELEATDPEADLEA